MSNETMSETPRVDNLIEKHTQHNNHVEMCFTRAVEQVTEMIALARMLERELTAMTAKVPEDVAGLVKRLQQPEYGYDCRGVWSIIDQADPLRAEAAAALEAMAREKWKPVCPDCRNTFLQPFTCITCGARRLYDATLKDAENRASKAETERDEEKDIVNRVWSTLGIESYDQARPFSIYDHIEKLKQRAIAAEAELKHQNEANDMLARERDAAVLSRDHTRQWYAERMQWLQDWFRGEGRNLPIANRFWNIVANGTPGVDVPPTYQQLLNSALHRAEKAEARLAAIDKAQMPEEPEWLARFRKSARPDYERCALDYDELVRSHQKLAGALQDANAETDKANALIDELRHERDVRQRIQAQLDHDLAAANERAERIRAETIAACARVCDRQSVLWSGREAEWTESGAAAVCAESIRALTGESNHG